MNKPVGRIRFRQMRRLCLMSLLVCALTAVVCGARAVPQKPGEGAAPDPQELYRQIREDPIDPSQVYFVREVRLNRGGVNIYLNRGFIGMLAPVGGRITGAVFSGDGEILLLPSNRVEKQSLAQFTKASVLEERFTTAYLRFTDNTAQEILEKARKPDPEDPEQPTGFAQQWNAFAERLSPEYSVRILEDFLGRQGLPFFYALLQGAALGEFEVTDDERRPEAMRVTGTRQKEGRIYADVWCSFPSRKSWDDMDALERGSARVTSYKIATRIKDDNSLEGRAELELESWSGADRVIAFELSSRLRIRDVRDEEGNKLVVLPPSPSEDASPGIRVQDWIAVVLKEPHPVGSKYRLNFTYGGNVIADVGNGVLYVGAHGSWYPNRSLSEPSSFDLTFHYPDRLTLVATGRRVEEGSAEGWRLSRWVSDGRFRVAGFNLGAYDSRVRKVGNVSVEVYATREVEAELEKRYLAEFPSVLIESHPMAEGRGIIKVIPAPAPPHLDPAALLDKVVAKTSETLRYFETLFGPFPYSRLALAQIPGNFGQGWPELVYLPTLSFLRGDERPRLGSRPRGEDLEAGLVVTHEIAHQWWGNEVGWKSYHDQWLSEGFASYASALALARDKEGERKFRGLLQAYKQDLLSKNSEGDTIESGGPIWLGSRLSSSPNPLGYDNIVYKKSCWVLHMLRKLMAEPRTGSDERFSKMLRDFVETYRGQNPSTEDFLQHANRYMTPALDLDGNHRLDWFFTDWVYGTGIPAYKLDVKTRRLADNRYEVQGTIEQSGVADNFEMLVPVVAVASRDKKVLLGRVAVGGSGGRFKFTTRFRPSRVTIDDGDLLAVVH